VATGFSAVTLLGVALTGSTIYVVETRTLETSLGARLLDVGRTGALLIDTDLHAEVEATHTRESAAYRQLQRMLAAIQDANHLADPIYTLAEFDEAANRAHFMVASRGPADPGEDYYIVPALRSAVRQAFLEGVPSHTGVYQNQHGAWISALAPLRDAAGRVYAVLDVDFRADVYLAERARMRYLILVASLLGGAAALALAVLFTRRISAPVTALAGGLAEVARGRFPGPLPVTSRDEIGGVTRLFNTMIREIARGRVAREARLAEQRALADENARLYHEATQAYAELARTQRQLLDARTLEALGRLAGGVAHDFNHLLTIVQGRAEILQRHLNRDDPLRRHADLIQKAAERAATLTHQLLAVGRRQVLQPRPLDLSAVVRGLETTLRDLVGDSIELQIVSEPDLGLVEADPAQLERVITNLAVNARDAMLRGGHLLLETANVLFDEAGARCYPGARRGAYVRLAVSDTGVGMSPDVQAHLFEPFFTTKAPGKGTGLGLATVYGIVQQSGGCIAVQSAIGRGTRVEIYLPRAPGPAGAPAPAPELVDASRA
jgi:signal transduction histidine kinase